MDKDVGRKREYFGNNDPVTNWTMSMSELTEVMEDPTDQDQDPYYGSTESSYWSSVYSTPSLLLLSPNGTTLENNDTGGVPAQAKAGGRDENLAKIEMAVLALLFILTLLGNCVVLLGIFFRRQKMTRMYYFILHLSVADLITAFFNVLTQLFWEITYRFQGGNFLCKFVKYTQILGPYSSSWVLVMTALDRYQAICYPLSNCTWTAKRSKVMLGIAWSISLFFCIPQLFIFSYRQVSTDPPEYDCWGDFPTAWAPKAYVTWYSITVFIIPLIILVFAYGCITRTIWINFNMKSASRNHDNFEKKMTRQDSDEGEGHSATYGHSQSQSQDESVFHRGNSGNRFSLRSSHSIPSGGNGGGNGASKKSANINLYNPSKYFLQTKSLSTSSGGGVESGNESKRKYTSVNNRTSTSSCTTQSTTLSPSLSGRRMSAAEDNDKSKNSLPTFLPSQKLFASNGVKEKDNNGGVGSRHHHHEGGDEEQLHLIPRERNELCHILETTRACHSSSQNENGNGSNGSTECLKNGSVKFSGASSSLSLSPPTCQHGCCLDRCNFCHSSANQNQGLNNSLIQASAAAAAELNNTEVVGGGRYRQSNATNATSHDKKSTNSRRFSSRFSRKGRGGSINERSSVGKQSTKSSSMATYVEQQPRTHSVKGISRAKIKTIKLTVTIICCYIFCSSPFIAAQLWSVYDPDASKSAFFSGPTFTILTLLASLNSCVNPFIFLFFNPNLLENCFRGIFPPKFTARRFNNGGGGGGSPLSRTLSQGKKAHFGVGVGANGNTATFNRSGSLGMRRNGGGGGSPPAHPSGPNHLSPLISSQDANHLEKVSERSESIPNAVELVSTPSPLSLPPPPLMTTTDSTSTCRVETTSTTTHSGITTLIS